MIAAGLRGRFSEQFGRRPQVVGRAPGRVNLIGEHTDYNGGPALPVALPHATYAAVGSRPDGLLRVASRQRPDVWEGPVEDLGPGRSEGWAAYVAGTVWALGEDVPGLPAGLDVLVDSAVPIGAGLSSSAALECAVAVAVLGLAGVDLDLGTRRAVAAACVRAETEVVGAPTGGMDQTVSMLAEPEAALLLDFVDPDDPGLRHVPIGMPGHTLLVTDTRVPHALTEEGYADRRRDCETAAATLGVDRLRAAAPLAVAALPDGPLRRRARHVVTEIGRVGQVVEALEAGDLAALGPLFAASHASLRDDFEVSCPELDAAVEAAVGAGALAARMTGGGFGGSTVAVVRTDRVREVAAAVDAAFAEAGFAAPAHLVATPAAGAGTV